MNKEKFGPFLANLRNEKKLTQEQLAEKLNVSSKTISKWECCQSLPDLETLFLIAELFNLSPIELSKCEKINNPLISKKDINKMINEKSIKKIIAKKIIIIASIFLTSSFFLFCILFTFANYNQVKIYSISSGDSLYGIEGYLIETNNKYYLSISNVKYLNQDNFNNAIIKDIKFLLFNDKKVIHQKKNVLKFPLSFDDASNKIKFYLNIFKSSHNTKQNLFIKIEYRNINNKNNSIVIPLKFKSIHETNQIYYSK